MKINVLDKGYVELKIASGYDFFPEETARMSTNKDKETRSIEDSIRLTRYLMRHQHTSPFEFCNIVFEINAPIFVIREWHRHRTQAYNEVSARYTKLAPEYYLPSKERVVLQSKDNKQGSSDESVGDLKTEYIMNSWKEEQDKFEESYEYMVDHGVANEIARLNMPVSHYSKFRASANLLNWFRFLQLRMNPHAQLEIREYANAIYKILETKYPECIKAFNDYWLNSVNFTSQEFEILKSCIDIQKLKDLLSRQISNEYWTKREETEFIGKIGFEQ